MNIPWFELWFLRRIFHASISPGFLPIFPLGATGWALAVLQATSLRFLGGSEGVTPWFFLGGKSWKKREVSVGKSARNDGFIPVFLEVFWVEHLLRIPWIWEFRWRNDEFPVFFPVKMEGWTVKQQESANIIMIFSCRNLGFTRRNGGFPSRNDDSGNVGWFVKKWLDPIYGAWLRNPAPVGKRWLIPLFNYIYW